MKCTITEYRDLAVDGNGNPMPIGSRSKLAVQSQSAVGAFSALNADTRFIRIATDTNITIDINGSAVDQLFLVGVDYQAVNGGEVLTTAIA